MEKYPSRHAEKTRVHAHRRAHTPQCAQTYKRQFKNNKMHILSSTLPLSQALKYRWLEETVTEGVCFIGKMEESFSGCFSCLFFLFSGWSKGIAVPILGSARYSSRNSTASQTGSCRAGEEEAAEEFTPQPRASRR